MNSKTVLIAGCGGLGCYNVEFMARLGIGKIIVVDGDTFSEGNMNRQLYCTEELLGTGKVTAAKKRWGDQIEPVNEFLTSENALKLLVGCDIAIDALDNVPSRKILADACEKAEIPMIHGAIGDTNSQVCAIFPGDKDILNILYPHDVSGKIRTVSYTPAFCASMQSALAHKYLKGEPLEQRTLYISDLSGMDFEKVKL